MSSYRITIKEVRDVEKTVGKDWAVVGQEYREEGGTKNVYGYTPEITKTVTETRQLLCQTVDALDMPKVIRAINNL